MAENPQKPKVIPIYQPFKQVSHLRSRHGMNIALVVIIILAAVLGSIFVTDRNNKNHQAAIDRSVRLVYANPAQGQISLTDNTGKVLNHATFPKGRVAQFAALSPGGAALVSVGQPGPLESFSVIGAAFKDLSPKAIAALSQAGNIAGSQHFVFTDEDNVAYVACSAKNTCKLQDLNLSSNDVRTLLSTTLQPQYGVAYAYLLGRSPDGKSLYLRVNGQNGLGSGTNVVYKIDTGSGKVQKTITMPIAVGYSLALSPDCKWLAYAQDTYANKTTKTQLHLINIASGQDHSIDWDKTGIADTSGALVWSPDSAYVLFRTATVQVAAGSKATVPAVDMAYLNVAKQQITKLQTFSNIKDSDINTIGWLDNQSVIYSTAMLTNPSKGSSVKYSTFKLSLDSRSTGGFVGPSAMLLAASY